MQNINDIITTSALGQVRTGNFAYQLFNYISNDGNIRNNENQSVNNMNDSLHFGLTKRLPQKPTESLANNTSPLCNGNDECSVLGQVIFDPLGYVGGIALGSGQGKNTKLGLVVNNNNDVIVNKDFIVKGNGIFNGINMFKYIAANTLEANNYIFSPKFIGTLSTPSSSSLPCTAGEFKDDENYHYVCVAENKWKRVALSNFFNYRVCRYFL